MADILKTLGVLDLIFLSILIVSVLLGLIRGVVREILSIVALVTSIYFAFKFSETLSTNYVSALFGDAKISYILSFTLIIVATLFAITLVNLFFSQLLRASGLGLLNRVLGMIFGLLRGALICSVLVIVLGLLPGAVNSSWWQASSLAPVFEKIASKIVSHVPDNVASYLIYSKENTEKTYQEFIKKGKSNKPRNPIITEDENAPLREENMENQNDTPQNGGIYLESLQ